MEKSKFKQIETKITKKCNDYLINNNCEWFMLFALNSNQQNKNIRKYDFQKWKAHTENNITIINVYDLFNTLIKSYNLSVHSLNKPIEICFYNSAFIFQNTP